MPGFRRVALVTAWHDESALERFLDRSPVAEMFAGGWSVRLEPLRAWGEWPAFGPLPSRDDSDRTEPVAALTLGRLRVARILPFLSASAGAEREARAHPAFLEGTALARPPGLVATFSLWRSAEGVRSYAAGSDSGGHRRAAKAHHRDPFHHESVFIRFRPYAARGSWDGRDPLSTT